MSIEWESKLIRDPLYGFVGFSKKKYKLLNTIALQRLSRIKQLSHTYIVYPSAVHTRFEHSLGTLYIAGRVCDELKLPENEKQIIRIAALLHDLGQGPFSHLFEEPMRWINGEKYSHEHVTRLIIENDSEVNRALGNLKQDILGVFDGDSLSSDIISSGLDVDKLDYLRRDSYHTGVAYGNFDLERVVRTVCKISEGDRAYLAIGEKGKDALESYRLARYAMHIQVYEHHTRLIADDMFLKAVKSAINEDWFAKEELKVSGKPNQFLNRFLKLDDYSIQHDILQNSTGTAKSLIQNIRNRRLLKRACEVPLTAEGVPHPIRRDKIISMTKRQVQNAERKIAREIGIESDYVIVHLQSVKIKLYERFELTIGRKEKPILVKKRNGSVVSFDQVSPISASLNPVRKLYVFCPEEHVSNVKSIAQDLFKVKSVI